jgi:hypothetical protein
MNPEPCHPEVFRGVRPDYSKYLEVTPSTNRRSRSRGLANLTLDLDTRSDR